MLSIRPLTSRKLISQVGLLLLASLLLAGCNDSDPYSGQSISGDVLEPSDVNPLDPTVKAATQVALFLNKPIKGLAYICQDGANHRSTIQFNSQTQDDSQTVVTTPVPVARCGNDASSITFYLGAKESLGVKNSVDLGRVFLPMISPIGSDGKARNYVTKTGTKAISGSTFFFQYSMLDMPASPARLSVANAFDGSGQCNAGKQDACKAVYVAALLMALDANGGMSDSIQVPAKANQLMAASSAYAGLGFSQSGFAAFKNDWKSYVADVIGGSESLAFSGIVLSDIINKLKAASSRLRAGQYALDYAGQISAYRSYYPDSQKVIDMGLASLTADFMVYPDGSISGFGLAAADLGSLCSQTSILNCLWFKLDEQNFISVYGDNGVPAHLTANMTLQSTHLKSVVVSAGNNDIVDVELFGRFFGDFLYDGREPQTLKGRTDFGLDYPKSNRTLEDSEKGSLVGDFFSTILPGYRNGGQVGMLGNDPAPFPVRLNKTSDIQNAPLDTSILGGLDDQNYRIQLMRLCDASTSSCTPVPTDEIGSGAGDNYPEEICLKGDQGGCTDKIVTATIGEMPRLNQLGGSQSEVNLGFVRSVSHPGRVVVQLLDNSCSPVNDSQGNPIRVGYVMATPGTNSADITLLFASPDQASQALVPHLGVKMAGRIDLNDNSWPLYRLGDTNFNSQIRAKWVVTNPYRVVQYVESLTSNPQTIDDLTLAERQNAFGMSSGAVKGQKLDASCNPVP